MWQNPQETADWSHLLKNSLIEDFIFFVVLLVWPALSRSHCMKFSWYWNVCIWWTSQPLYPESYLKETISRLGRIKQYHVNGPSRLTGTSFELMRAFRTNKSMRLKIDSYFWISKMAKTSNFVQDQKNTISEQYISNQSNYVRCQTWI